MPDESVLSEIVSGKRDVGDLDPSEVEELRSDLETVRGAIRNHIETMRELERELSRQHQMMDGASVTEADRWADGFVETMEKMTRVRDALYSDEN